MRVLQGLARPGTQAAWARIVRALLGPQGPEVVERLAVFPVIADALDSGDLSRLDPLPPSSASSRWKC